MIDLPVPWCNICYVTAQYIAYSVQYVHATHVHESVISITISQTKVKNMQIRIKRSLFMPTSMNTHSAPQTDWTLCQLHIFVVKKIAVMIFDHTITVIIAKKDSYPIMDIL